MAALARTKRPAVTFDPDPLAVFAARVRELRREHGYSQEELAARSGLDPTFISACENARRNPSLISIWRLALALDTEPAALLRLPDEPA